MEEGGELARPGLLEQALAAPCSREIADMPTRPAKISRVLTDQDSIASAASAWSRSTCA